MGEAQRRKARGEYPARTPTVMKRDGFQRPDRDRRWLPNLRAPSMWFGKRERDGAISFPDATRYLATTVAKKSTRIPGPWRRLVLTANGWKLRSPDPLSGRQRVRARKASRRANRIAERL